MRVGLCSEQLMLRLCLYKELFILGPTVVQLIGAVVYETQGQWFDSQFPLIRSHMSCPLDKTLKPEHLAPQRISLSTMLFPQCGTNEGLYKNIHAVANITKHRKYSHRPVYETRVSSSRASQVLQSTGSQQTLNMGHCLLLRPNLLGSLTFFLLACSVAPAMPSPVLTMLSLVQFDYFKSVLISALSFCSLSCQDRSLLRGSRSSRQSEGFLAD